MRRCNPLRGVSFFVTIFFFLLTLFPLFSTSALAQDRVSISAYGPETFTRATGKPKQEIRAFTFPRTDSSFTIRVTNGDPKITSAVIQLNGETIFSPDDFKKKVPTLERTISLTSENTLIVELRSKPGSFITIDISGEFLPPAAPLIDPITSPTNKATQTITGTAVPGGAITISGRGEEAGGPCNPSTGVFSIHIGLNEGANNLLAWVTDTLGLRSDKIAFEIIVDTTPPQIAITSPADRSELSEEIITVIGTIDDTTATVTVNGVQATVESNTFTASGISLSEGETTITATAIDPVGNTSSDSVVVILCTKKDIDLTPYRIDVSGISTDAQSLKTSGTVNVTIVNNGQDPVSEPFKLLLFEDVNNNGEFDAETDNVLARTTVSQGIPASGTLDVPLDIMGELLFTGNLFFAYVDSKEEISELDETNNIGSSEREGIDLTGSYIRIDTTGCPDSVTLTARVGNAGNIQVGQGVKMAFYVNATDGNLQWIDTGRTANPLAPGRYEDITVTWNNPDTGARTIYAQADDTGSGTGVYPEADESNNVVAANIELCLNIPAIGENSITGRISDAVTGAPLSGAVVILTAASQGGPAETIAQTETNGDGYYLFEGLDAGGYIIEAEYTGFIPESRQVILYAGQSLSGQHIVLSPELAADETRIILTWGETPADLEAHLTGPNAEGCRYHCYFWERGFPGAQLDKDTQNGYGPETITITQTGTGIYRYYVHDWTNRLSSTSTGLADSGAEVRVYIGNTGESVAFMAPSEPGTVWHVFDLDGQTGRITPVNRMTSQDDAGDIDFPVITSRPVANACVGVSYMYQVEAIDPDNDTLTYNLEACPPGMTINQNTGLISWVPAEDQKTGSGGTHTVNVRVSDGRCGTDTQTFGIKVGSIMIKAYPAETIYPGQSCTLSWTCDSAYSCSIDQGIGAVDASGSLKVFPADDTTYTITGVGPAETIQASVTVIVEPYAQIASPPVCDWTPGEGVTITWSTQGAEVCLIEGIGQVEPNGFLEVFPTKPTIYTLTASGSSGATTASTQAPSYEPVVITFNASSTHILPGESTTLSWNTTRCVERCELYRVEGNAKTFIGEGGPTGSITVSPTQNTIYTLEAYRAEDCCGTKTIWISTSPVVNLSAYPHPFYPDQPITLTWNAQYAESCSIDQGVGDVPLNGSLQVYPTQTTTYTITATGPGGVSTSSKTASHVEPVVTFSADPNIIKSGDTTTLIWNTQYADSCSIEPGVGEVPVNGSVEVHPTQTTRYILTATGPGGTRESSITVFYVKPSVSIMAEPPIIVPGEPITLTWTSGLADYCVINNNIGEVDASGSLEVSPSGPTTYTITAYGPGGEAASSVTVSFLEVSMWAYPVNVSSGQASALTWTSVHADSCSIEPEIGEVPANGSIDVYPAETTTYKITAYGYERTASDSATVTLRVADDIDIRPIGMETDISVDSQTLAISGYVTVNMERSGQEGLLDPFQVVAFEDRNCNGIYDPADDNVLGSKTVNTQWWSSATYSQGVTITGTLLFRDNRLYVLIDAEDVLNELDESNNIIHSGTNGPDTVDLSASFIRIDNTQCPAAATLTARIGNGGNLPAAAGVKTTFYDGPPDGGGYPIGTVSTTEDLAPGRFQDVSLTWNVPAPGLHAIYGRADDDGTGAGNYAEAEINNLVKTYLSVCGAGEGEDPGSISGLVLDGQNSNPLKDVTVFLREIENDNTSTIIDMATSGADGYYLFDTVTPGSYVVEASLARYRVKTLPVTLCSGEPLTGQDLSLLPYLSVTITSPAADSTVGVSPVTVTGTVNYNTDSVMVNGVSAVVTGNTFTATGIELSEGKNTITAVAWDVDGNMAEKTVEVSFDPTLFAVEIFDPADGSTASGGYLTVQSYVSHPPAKVTINGIPGILEGRPEYGQYAAYNVPIAEGANTITATATDQCGRTATHSITVYGAAGLPPSLTITEPYEKNIYHNPLIVSGVIADDSATVMVNGITAVVDNKTFSAEIFLAEGENIITATATDKNGTTATNSITVTYQTAPPTCTIPYPESGLIYTGSQYWVKVCSSLRTITANGEITDTWEDNSFYYFWVLVDLVEGPNVVTATASDSYGNTAEASIVIFRPTDDWWPWIYITSPKRYATVNNNLIDVTGIVGGSSTFVTVNGVKATVENGTFIATGVELVYGYNDITATATGPYSTTETSTTRVYCRDTVPPIVAIDSPQNGAKVYTSYITVTGTIDDNNATVTVNSVSAMVANNTFTAENIYLTGGTNIITATAKDQRGNTATASITVIKPVHVDINSPEHMATINRPEVMVEGTYEAATEGAVVMVNDTPAILLDDGRFIANAVPLQVGENTLTATITDSNGNADEYSITVYADEIVEDVRLSSNIQSGAPPLETTFTVEYSYTNIDNMIVQADMDFEGDGVMDLNPASTTFTHTYETPGVYYPTITLTDELGNIYTATAAIVIYDRNTIDALIKSKWTGMKQALVDGDIETAVSYFAEGTPREMFRYNFNLLGDKLPQLIENMGPITLISVEDNVAEYEMIATQDGVECSFYVEFVKDKDGIWRLTFF